MLNTYHYMKNLIAIGAIASLSWFGANAFAAQTDDLRDPVQVEDLDAQPKLLSEMTADEKAKLTKEERRKLEELEAKIKSLETPKYE